MPMKRSPYVLSLLVLVSGLSVPLTTFAIGLAVSPSSLELEGTPGETVEMTLTVENDSDEVAYFETYPDAFEPIFEVSPESFTLEAKESRTLIVRAQAEQNGSFSTELSVVARPLADSAYQAAGGIKVPLRFIAKVQHNDLTAMVLGAMTSPPALLMVILLMLAGSLIAYRRRKAI